MRYLITGAGQIGQQLALDLSAAGHEVTVLRRGTGQIAGARTISGDAGDRQTLREAAAGAAAIFHCIHAAYSAKVWRAELPQREAAVMDIAAELDIPVVFPESVYAFGLGARTLSERAPLAPVSPLGEVRAELLRARAAHRARTASIVASDLFGPTATGAGSVVLSTVVKPASKGKSAWALGDPDVAHAVTYIPDLSRAMIAAVPLAEQGGTTLLAPTAPARTLRQMASDAATIAGQAQPERAKVTRISGALLAIGGLFSAPMRELRNQQYLWAAPSTLEAGRLTTELGLQPTPWADTLAEWAHTPATNAQSN